jgi:hypothetical protein
MVLKTFIKHYAGSSFPTLIETESGSKHILKMRGAGNGSTSLLSEFISNKVANKLKWSVPDVDWIYIPDNFPWVFGTDEFDDIVQKSYGWNLAVEYIPNAIQADLKFIETADEDLLNRIYTLDLFFVNVDRTETSNNFLKDDRGQIWIIDHGSLGLFQSIDITRKELFNNHIFHKMLPNKEFVYDYMLNNNKLFLEAIDLIPDSIISEGGFTKETLYKRIAERIKHLSK